MHTAIANTVLSSTGAQTIRSATVIQSLWSGYGEIVRLELEGSTYPSVILKHIKLPEAGSHPRGWNTGRSHNRKIRSYQVEAHWYQDYADARNQGAGGLSRSGSDYPGYISIHIANGICRHKLQGT